MSFLKLLLSILALTSATLAQTSPQYGDWPTQTFKTENFTVPIFNVSKSGAPLGDGYIFFEYLTSQTQEASLIMTDEGDLIWSSPTFNKTSNTIVQYVYGEPVLTYWTGVGSTDTNLLGHGYGEVHFLDTTYTEIFTICPDFGLVFIDNETQACQADAHESYINTAKNTLLVTAYNLTQTDLTPVGGPVDGWVWDCLFYEIDIKSQNIMFSWSALGAGLTPSLSKSPINGSGTAQNKPYDWFHINSIQSIGDGYLINARDTWTSYMLNSNGDIEWEFEGSHGGDFKKPENISFEFEHHARAHNVTNTSMVLTMFDNANSSPPFYEVNQTLGLMWYLDLTTKVATLLQDKYVPSSPLYSSTQGSNELLHNGNTIMGYGELPYIREYGPGGICA